MATSPQSKSAARILRTEVNKLRPGQRHPQLRLPHLHHSIAECQSHLSVAPTSCCPSPEQRPIKLTCNLHKNPVDRWPKTPDYMRKASYLKSAHYMNHLVRSRADLFSTVEQANRHAICAFLRLNSGTLCTVNLSCSPRLCKISPLLEGSKRSVNPWQAKCAI
jgi:hypothetical protein